MKGVVLSSHGMLAEGIITSANMIFGESENICAVTFSHEMSPEDLLTKLQEAVKKVDSGDGVIVCVDLLGGTPSNAAIYLIEQGVDVITGLNLPMVIELLSSRLSGDPNIFEIIEASKNGITHLNKLMEGINNG